MIDLNQCKAGDKLLSSLGSVLVYIEKKSGPEYPHVIMYPNGSFGTRSDNGQVYKNHHLPSDHDIVEVLPSHTLINTWKNPADSIPQG